MLDNAALTHILFPWTNTWILNLKICLSLSFMQGVRCAADYGSKFDTTSLYHII